MCNFSDFSFERAQPECSSSFTLSSLLSNRVRRPFHVMTRPSPFSFVTGRLKHCDFKSRPSPRWTTVILGLKMFLKGILVSQKIFLFLSNFIRIAAERLRAGKRTGSLKRRASTGAQFREGIKWTVQL